MPYLFFIFGLFVGSFLNVVILRLEGFPASLSLSKHLSSIFLGRSKCPKCRKKLPWYDLVPLVSFVALKGKCRYCKKPISLQYPLVEFFTGLLFALLFVKFGLSLVTVYWLLITGLLIILFVYDLKTQTIPDTIAYLGIGLAFVYSIFNFKFSIFNSILAPIIAGGFFAILVLISKERWMGQGDIKIGALMGLLLGYPNVLVGLFLAFIMGALAGLILIAMKKKTLKSQIPFGPFLILAIFITIFFGEKILNWYLGTLY